MKICIFGVGAIGGFLAAYLTNAGHDVTVIARGTTLSALRERGLELHHRGRNLRVRPAVAEDPCAVGPVDIVFVAVKAPALPAAGEGLGRLLGGDTPVVFAMNGIPWWYDHGRSGGSAAVTSVLDPTGSLGRNVGADRAIGCVVDCPSRVVEPGIVVCNSTAPGIFTLGEPDGSLSERVRLLSRTVEAAGMGAPVSREIRRAIWNKLVVNLSRSPLAVLTGASEAQLATAPGVNMISEAMIREAGAVAEVHGIDLALDWYTLLDPACRIEHRPSMLQDWDAERPMEIDSIVAIVSHLAAEAGLTTPVIDQVLALLTLKARAAGLY